MCRLRFVSLLLMPLLTLTAMAQEKPRSTPYYPLKAGNEWTYRAGKESVVVRVDKEVTLQFTGNEKDAGPAQGDWLSAEHQQRCARA